MTDPRRVRSLLVTVLFVALGAAGAAFFHVLVPHDAVAAAGSGHQVIAAPDAPKAVGPYSQAVKAGSFVFVAGQLPLDPKTGQIVPGGIEEQTKRVMENIKGILAADGLTMKNVVMSNCYLKSMDDFAKFNATYGTYF